MSRQLRGAVIGYGGAFNMGKQHGEQMIASGIEFAAVCDLDAVRAKQAELDFPGIGVHTNPEELLQRDDIDLITVITPHNTHAELGMRILQAGKHCILEKPMCIRAEDGLAMIELARRQGKMLTVYHNRRWDGWYTTLKDLIARDIIGDIFHVEMAFTGYEPPRSWWRSDKSVSGGAMYDWGAHLIDYALGIVPGKIRSVRGVVHNRLWHECTNEDHVDSTIYMESGAVIRVEISSIAHAGKPQIRVLGTKGGIIDANIFDGEFILSTQINGVKVESIVTTAKSEGARFYTNVADHLYRGAELEVKPEQALRNIAVIESTERSHAEGKELPVPYEA